MGGQLAPECGGQVQQNLHDEAQKDTLFSIYELPAIMQIYKQEFYN
jgi:hypothetical protein